MDINKMRRHNQLRRKDPLRGWRGMGMIDSQSAGFGDILTWDIYGDPHVPTLPRPDWVAAMASQWGKAFDRSSFFIAPLDLPIVNWSLWDGAVDGYLAGDGDTIVRGTD